MSGLPAPSCEVDQWVLTELGKRQRSGETVSALLVGIGAEDQAVRMADAGARVLLFSDRDPAEHLNIVRQPLASLASLHTAEAPLPLQPFDLILSQRSLSTLRYDEALIAVRRFLQRLKIGGKLFISLYGIHSDLGDGYPDGSKLVGERLAPVAPEVAERYGLRAPLCLYSERNLFALLMEAGGVVLKTSTSALGHVRGVAARI
jgi:hypothetical protein